MSVASAVHIVVALIMVGLIFQNFKNASVAYGMGERGLGRLALGGAGISALAAILNVWAAALA